MVNFHSNSMALQLSKLYLFLEDSTRAAMTFQHAWAYAVLHHSLIYPHPCEWIMLNVQIKLIQAVFNPPIMHDRQI